ncbi:MAG: hypothetical protein IKO29_02220 [Bacteroidales bacterium]|nr:hypothetical protein [Bacteroidales bacterium]
MKKLFLALAFAAVALFSSCDNNLVNHTGDATGNLNAVWKLGAKTVITTGSDGKQVTEEADYGKVNFFLALGDFPFPHAIAKKGSFTDLDLNDVDVDACRYTYNADENKISFSKLVSLTEGFLPLYSMSLLGTFDVLELTDKTFVIQQKALGVTTIYAFSKYK